MQTCADGKLRREKLQFSMLQSHRDMQLLNPNAMHDSCLVDLYLCSFSGTAGKVLHPRAVNNTRESFEV